MQKLYYEKPKFKLFQANCLDINELVSNFLAPELKPSQTFEIILPNLITNLKNEISDAPRHNFSGDMEAGRMKFKKVAGSVDENLQTCFF